MPSRCVPSLVDDDVDLDHLVDLVFARVLHYTFIPPQAPSYLRAGQYVEPTLLFPSPQGS